MKIPICLIFPFVLLFPHARAENPDDFSPERKTCILHLRSVRDSLQKDIDSKRLRINAILFTEGIAELTVADQPYIRLPFPCLGYDDLDDYVRAVDSLQTFDRSYYPAAQRRRDSLLSLSCRYRAVPDETDSLELVFKKAVLRTLYADFRAHGRPINTEYILGPENTNRVVEKSHERRRLALELGALCWLLDKKQIAAAALWTPQWSRYVQPIPTANDSLLARIRLRSVDSLCRATERKKLQINKRVYDLIIREVIRTGRPFPMESLERCGSIPVARYRAQLCRKEKTVPEQIGSFEFQLRLLKTIATDFRRQRKLLPEGEVTQLARYLDINADAKIMLLREELDVLEQKTEQAIETYVEQKYL